MQTRYKKHDENHWDIEQYVQDEDGNWLWAVIACLGGNIDLDDEMNTTPAVLVTGSDAKGNEFSYWKMYDGVWVDGYNEVQRPDDFIRKYVFPEVRKVYFGDFIMDGSRWVEGGFPMSATKEQINLWKHPSIA